MATTTENKIYVAMYCRCSYESAFTNISIHRTKKGAYKAMRNHILNRFMEDYESGFLYGKDKMGGNPIKHEAWKVKEVEILE